MTPSDFVNCIHKEVIERNLNSYDALLSIPDSNIKDPQIHETLHAYSTMDKRQQLAVRQIVRKAMIDTSSSILGILDGTTILADYRKDFLLTYGNSKARLNGDLQDYFLAYLEDK